jgi:DHA2 family methylenomycin A resistance protein-like MFS transporter
MLVGLSAGTAGLAALAVTTGAHLPYWLLVAPLVAAGFGMSFTMPAATAAVMEAAPEDRSGLASGTLNAARQMGGVVGVALLGTLVAQRTDFTAGLHAGLAIAADAFGLAALLTFVAVE